MLAYIKVRVNISDSIVYGKNIRRTPRVFDRFGGHALFAEAS